MDISSTPSSPVGFRHSPFARPSKSVGFEVARGLRINATMGSQFDMDCGLAESELPVLVVDLDGRIVLRGRGAAEQLARLADASSFDPGRDLPAELLSVLENAPAGEATVWYAEGPQGSELPIGCTRYALDQEHHAVLLRDIGEKHDHMSRMLHRQRLESLGRLAASVAHDLRTCVASIVYNADALGLAGASGDPDLVPMIAAEVRQASDRLQRTINNLLEFGRHEPDITEHVELAPLMRRIYRWIQPVLDAKEHRIRWTEGRPGATQGNAIAIEQILLNLILNAIEAVPGDARVQVSWEQGVDGTLVHITDDGPGIPDDVARRVFDPFFSTKKSGSGLGLFSARETARRLGGDLWLESNQSPCRFTVRLPAAVREPAVHSPIQAQVPQ